MRRSEKPTSKNPWTDADYFDYLKSRCTVTEEGCWIHPGSQTHPRGMREGALGYTQVTIRGRRYMTHRWVYEFVYGFIPDEMVVGHKCDTPPCCNPGHLVAMTELQNSADMIAKQRNFEQQRTECPKGHPYDAANTLFVTAKSGRPARQCRTCNREKQHEPGYVQWRRDYQRKRRARLREQRLAAQQEQTHG